MGKLSTILGQPDLVPRLVFRLTPGGNSAQGSMIRYTSNFPSFRRALTGPIRLFFVLYQAVSAGNRSGSRFLVQS